jgi:hypothetical protein
VKDMMASRAKPSPALHVAGALALLATLALAGAARGGVPADPTGACCQNGTCAERTEADCLALPGSYRGDDISCGSVECSEPDCIDSAPRIVAAGGTNGVVSVHAADLDGDGDLDVLSASVNDDKIAWYENDGGSPPAFTEHVISTSTDGATAVYAGDLDGDGQNDVVSASANDNRILWFQNDGGSPTRFIGRTITDGALNASAVHIANVDKTGCQDVLSASINDNKIAWYRNESAACDRPPDPGSLPSFTEVVVSLSASGASSVFAAELFPDDDDHLELLAASRLSNRISWYERRVEVDPETRIEVVAYVEQVIDTDAPGAAAVHAADLSGEGRIDVLSASASDGRIAWYRNLGPVDEDGTPPDLRPAFQKVVITAQAAGARAVHAADLDGDGDLDVLSASRTDGKIAWYENLGGGDFGDLDTNQRLIAVATGAAAVHAADLDGVNGADVVAAASVPGAVASSDQITWHENDGARAFTTRTISAAAVAPEALLAVDVDGDLDVDVLAASSVDGRLLRFTNDGAASPTFARSVLADDAAGARDLFWADLDGDADLDLLAALASQNSIVWYENLGGGDFGDPATNRRNISLQQASGASSVFAIDLDLDGAVDVLSSSASDDKISWYRNLGGGTFGVQNNITTGADGAQSVYATDIDGDDDVDVLAASGNDDSIRWFENTSTPPTPPAFVEHLISDIEQGARDVLAVDLDGDGDLDIVSAASDDDSISWFRNDGLKPAGFDSARPVNVLPADFLREILAVALDDGDVDIVSVSSGDDTLAWYQNDIAEQPPPGEGEAQNVPGFTRRRVDARAESARATAVADLDGDGFQDLVVGFLFEIAWHRGNAVEVCSAFDVEGDDGEIDGEELALLAAVFGRICANGSTPDPELDPWAGIDYNGDCQVDGNDLAILTSFDVWGNSTADCAYTCP